LKVINPSSNQHVWGNMFFGEHVWGNMLGGITVLGCTVLFSTSIYHLKYLMGEQGIKDPSPHFKTHIDPALS